MLSQGLAAEGSDNEVGTMTTLVLQGTGDLLDGSNVPGASKGNIEGGGASGLGLGTVLQDLRETYLALFGGAGKERDQAARVFDAQLTAIAAGSS